MPTKKQLEEQIKNLKEENEEYKLRDENTTTYKGLEKENEKLKEEKEYWEKDYWNLMDEFKFMMCYHEYNNIPNNEGGDINDPNSPMGKLLLELPSVSFWKDDFHDDFTKFISDLVKNTVHKRD